MRHRRRKDDVFATPLQRRIGRRRRFEGPGAEGQDLVYIGTYWYTYIILISAGELLFSVF